MKRSMFVMLIILIIGLTACNGDATPADQGATDSTTEQTAGEGTVPERPVIRLRAEGENYDGLQGAYCWLQAVNDVRCEPDPLVLEPEVTVGVENGEVIAFTIESDIAPPSAFYATLLDDTDAAGNRITMDFGSRDSVEYTVDLDPGIHRFSVVAEYQTDRGDNNFVTSVFAIEIPEAVAEVPTEAPTATEQPTRVPPTAAPEETEALIEPTEEETIEPTAKPTVVPPTMEPTEVPATVAPSPTEEATEAPPTATQVSPTMVPPTAVPPTPAPTTAPPQMSVPSLVAVNGGQTFAPSGTEYCMQEAGGQTCTDLPASAQSERILINNGDTLRFDAENGGPVSMTFILTNLDASQEFLREEVPGNAISLFTVTGTPGNYILRVDTRWTEATITYYFRLQIVG